MQEVKQYSAPLLAWFLPGLGHLYLREKKKAGLFFVILTGLFLTGLLMKGGIVVLDEDLFFISRLLQFCHLFNGSLFLITFFYSRLNGITVGDITHPLYEIGQLCILIAALLNILVIFNAYDLAREKTLNQEKK